MKILKGFYAIFWRTADHKQQFHADVPDNVTPAQALAAFKAMFPQDVVCSIRDQRGRFIKVTK